jgi:hypothetical protein
MRCNDRDFMNRAKTGFKSTIKHFSYLAEKPLLITIFSQHRLCILSVKLNPLLVWRNQIYVLPLQDGKVKLIPPKGI